VKATLSWLREFAPLPESATVADVAARIAGAGFEVASIEGETIDFEITANRPDCLSIRGLAREAATAYEVLGSWGPEVLKSWGPEVLKSTVPVTIESDLCGRYALALADVKIGPSPAWLTERLTACGVRPINNVVDVTNYVMIEMGQPMHAFDVTRLAGPEIRVRLARTGERLTTLDGQERKLDPSMLVIADRDRAVALAGVMGGAASEVSASTTRIALESAYFQPGTVRATSKRLSLKTEASARFERGGDPAACAGGLARALDLIEQIGAGRRAEGGADAYPTPPAERVVMLGRDHLDRLLGDTVPDEDVERILTSLGFDVTSVNAGEGWSAAVPSWRVDVSREADLIEEVGRHWGVNRVPATFPALTVAPRRSSRGVVRARRLRRLLCGAGLQEAVTFTFIEEAAATPFVEDAAQLVAIANPLSEKFAVLRPSMLPGLLDALIYNRRRDMDDVRLFEAGAVFTSAGERQRLGWVLCGARVSHWSQPPAAVDVYDACGVAEMLADAFALQCHTEAAADAPWSMPGRTAALIADHGDGATRIGTVGQVRPEVVAARGLSAGVVIAGEIDVDALRDTDEGEGRIAPLPRHPAMVRDLSIVLDAGLPAAAVRGTIRAHAPATLVGVREFDRYLGTGIPEGQVSLSLRLTFRDPDRTLTDSEVQQAMELIVDALASTHGASLRR
jgi:phenylalanyl-tRNA synthetase beta chain